jgi:hypothetical protein
MKIRAVSDDGSVYYLNSVSPDSTRWEAESLTEETLKLDFRAVPVGDYHLEIGMFDGDNPIKLGFKNDCNAQDGYYRVSKITVNSL